MPEKAIREHILARAWCFTNDGKRMTAYSGIYAIHVDAAAGQNKRLRELAALRKAGKKAGTKRPIGIHKVRKKT